MFEFLRQMIDTPEGKAIYILTLIFVVMMVDFLTGSLAAWMNPKVNFNSNAGINGLLRKFTSILVLFLCIPISILMPSEIGMIALYVLYLGYLLMEVKSIFENMEKLGIDVSPLTGFIRKLEEELKKDDANGKSSSRK